MLRSIPASLTFEPTPEPATAFCYVDTRRRLGHNTGYLWMDPALMGGAGGS